MSEQLLNVEGVEVRYGAVPAIRNLNIFVEKGEIVTLLGANGAGKTTTLRMILGITAPDQGKVRMDGCAGLDRGRTGYLPEERGLFDDASIMETLAYLGALRGMRLAQLTPEICKAFYAEHVGKPFYPSLEAFIATPGPEVDDKQWEEFLASRNTPPSPAP